MLSPKWVLWEFDGCRVPHLGILEMRGTDPTRAPFVTEREKKHQLAGPVLIKQEHMSLGVSELIPFYPCPFYVQENPRPAERVVTVADTLNSQ